MGSVGSNDLITHKSSLELAVAEYPLFDGATTGNVAFTWESPCPNFGCTTTSPTFGDL